MKLVSYKTEDRDHLGVFINGHIFNLNSCDKLIPDTMTEFLEGGIEFMDRAKKVNEDIFSGRITARQEVFFEMLAPVPHPTSHPWPASRSRRTPQCRRSSSLLVPYG